jgi:hypothetical protein
MQKGCILTGLGFSIWLDPNRLGNCYISTDLHPLVRNPPIVQARKPPLVGRLGNSSVEVKLGEHDSV